MTQEQMVIQFMNDGQPKSIKDIHDGTGILRPNVRRILGQGEKSGKFERTGKGVYVAKTSDGKVVAYVNCQDAKTALDELVSDGAKFDMIFVDAPYFSRALVGGNRGIKYSFVSPGEFAEVMKSVFSLIRDEESHVYVMLSGADTAQVDMEKYVAAVVGSGLKLVTEGSYTKTFADGKPVTNVRGEQAKPERLMLFTQSGAANYSNMNFVFQRPKGYQSEKAKELLRALIEQATKVGDFILDMFGGSGVTAEQAILSGRSVYLVEKSEDTVSNFILPRVRSAINSYNFLI